MTKLYPCHVCEEEFFSCLERDNHLRRFHRMDDEAIKLVEKETARGEFSRAA